MEETTIKFYTDKPTWYAYPEKGEQKALRDKHATISVIKHRMGKLPAVDDYLCDCEKRFKVEYLKQLNGSVLSAWENTMKELNAQLFPRGKNTVLECLQFGGNKEFWNGYDGRGGCLHDGCGCSLSCCSGYGRHGSGGVCCDECYYRRQYALCGRCCE